MCLEAFWGQMRETLNCVGYDHSWVRVYTYADDAAPLLPKGTIPAACRLFQQLADEPQRDGSRNWSGAGMRSVDQMLINLARGILPDGRAVRGGDCRAAGSGSASGPGDTVVGCPLCGLDDPLGNGAGEQ